MSKLDKLIKNSLKDTPELDPQLNKTLADCFAQTSYQQDKGEEETTVFHVEEYKRPNMVRRLGSLAAAFAVIAALGGGVYAMSGLRGQPQFANVSEESPAEDGEDDITAEVNSDVSEEESSDIISYASTEGFPENTYDMSTKEGIFNKMLNSVDFYDRLSGKIVTPYCVGDNQDKSNIYDYQIDVTTGTAHLTYSCLNLKNSLNDILLGDMPEGWEGGKATHGEMYSDGTQKYWLNVNDIEGTYHTDDIVYAMDSRTADTIGARDEIAVNGAQVRAYMTAEDSDRVKCSRTGVNALDEYLNPWGKIISNLYNFDTWDFEPCITNSGDAVNIHGTNPYHYNEFSMTVDCATGLMISYCELDNNGNVVDYMITHELYINEDAEAVPFIDMNEYRPFTDDDLIESYKYKINSKGQTYGVAGEYNLNESNRESLPDLVAFGTGYINTDEFLETIGDESNLHDTHHYNEPSETEELLYELKVYDCELNYIYSVYYYDGYIDQ